MGYMRTLLLIWVVCGSSSTVPSNGEDSGAVDHPMGVGEKTLITEAEKQLAQGVSPNGVVTRDANIPLLFIAAQQDYAGLASYLLQKGADPNSRRLLRGKRSMSVLEEATWRNSRNVARLLVQKNAIPGIRTAAMLGLTKRMHELLREDPNIAGTPLPTGEYPLHWAGSESMVTFLVGKGAKVEAKDSHGCTAMYWGVCRGATDVVKALLLMGYRPSVEAGANYLKMAAQLGYPDLVDLLASHGMRQTVYDKRGWLPLHYAVASADSCEAAAIVQLLLAKGMDLSAKDSEGLLPMEGPAARWFCSLGEGLNRPPPKHAETVKVLLEKGADPNAKTRRTGETPAHFAGRYLRSSGNVDELERMLTRKMP